MKKYMNVYHFLVLVTTIDFVIIAHDNELTEDLTTKALVVPSDSDTEATNSNDNSSTLSTTQPYLHPMGAHAHHDNPLSIVSSPVQTHNLIVPEQSVQVHHPVTIVHQQVVTQEKVAWWKIFFPCCSNDQGIAPKNNTRD